MRRLVQHLSSPPMAVALLALFVALGGSAYAINSVKAPKNSVVAKSIARGAVTAAKLRKGAVTGAKIADNAVNGAKVAPKSLGPADIDVASLGIPKSTKFLVRTAVKDVALNPNQGTSISAACLPGEIVVGGGGRSSNSFVHLAESIPFTAPSQGWTVQLFNTSATNAFEPQIAAYAICAST